MEKSIFEKMNTHFYKVNSHIILGPNYYYYSYHKVKIKIKNISNN